jgi:hypothetical protein
VEFEITVPGNGIGQAHPAGGVTIILNRCNELTINKNIEVVTISLNYKLKAGSNVEIFGQDKPLFDIGGVNTKYQVVSVSIAGFYRNIVIGFRIAPSKDNTAPVTIPLISRQVGFENTISTAIKFVD